MATIQIYRPADGNISQGLGAAQRQGSIHAGTDFFYCEDGVNVTDKIYAAAEGRVLFAGDSRDLPWPNIMYLNIDFDRTDNVDSSAGNYTIIEHYDAQGNVIARSGYGHQAEIYVKTGDWVTARQHIGKIGQTGFCYGPHLHFDFVIAPFEVSVAPLYGRVDPTPYFITNQEEDDMYTDADRARDEQAAVDAKAAKDAIINGGPSMKYGASIQNLVDDIPRRMAEYPVLRDGKKISWIQETADAKSIALRQEAKITALIDLLSKTTGGSITVDEVTQIIDAAVDRSLGALTGTATVTIGHNSDTAPTS